MGQAIAAAAAADGIVVAASLDVGDDIAAGIALGEVVVDFSFHAATEGVLAACLAARKPLVVGTTGHAAGEKQRLLAMAGGLPVVWAGNY